MATQEQKDMVTKSIEYWLLEKGRSGLTIPFLSVVSGLTPAEVLEAVGEVRPKTLDDVCFCLSYCSEIGEPIITWSNAREGHRSVDNLLVSSYLANNLGITYLPEVVIHEVLNRTAEDMSEGHETKVYTTKGYGGYEWAKLPEYEKQTWRDAVKNWKYLPPKDEWMNNDPQLA